MTCVKCIDHSMEVKGSEGIQFTKSCGCAAADPAQNMTVTVNCAGFFFRLNYLI